MTQSATFLHLFPSFFLLDPYLRVVSDEKTPLAALPIADIGVNLRGILNTAC
jgi:hypothetical protein